MPSRKLPIPVRILRASDRDKRCKCSCSEIRAEENIRSVIDRTGNTKGVFPAGRGKRRNWKGNFSSGGSHYRRRSIAARYYFPGVGNRATLFNRFSLRFRRCWPLGNPIGNILTALSTTRDGEEDASIRIAILVPPGRSRISIISSRKARRAPGRLDISIY